MDVTKPSLQPDALDIALGGEKKKEEEKRKRERKREKKEVKNGEGGNIQGAVARKRILRLATFSR